MAVMLQRWLLMMEGKLMRAHRLNEEFRRDRDVLCLASSPEARALAGQAPVVRGAEMPMDTRARDWLFVASKAGGVKG